MRVQKFALVALGALVIATPFVALPADQEKSVQAESPIDQVRDYYRAHPQLDTDDKGAFAW